MDEFPCPCCGHLVFDQPPGSYGLCPICFWEDDPVQLRWPDYAGGANRSSLIQSQRNFREFGAVEATSRRSVRTANEADVVDEGWRPIDSELDDFEPRGEKTTSWPTDGTVLYWWRPTFWRRVSGST